MAKYFSKDINLHEDIFLSNNIYFNIDSVQRISSIIFELKEESILIQKIKNEIGNMISNVSFNGGTSFIKSNCKGWINSENNIMI